MALTHKRTEEAANAAVDAMAVLADNGYLRIYSGTQPYNAETQLSGQTLLAQLRFADPAFSPAFDGLAYADTLTPEDSVLATAVATWFRVFKSDGTTPLWDGSVGETDCNINLGSVDFVVGDTVAITEYYIGEGLDYDG
jgi:hypothetical protein